jgi:hypothetical protein
MIQRIQTVYLILGAAALAAVFAFSSPWSSTAAETYAWYVPVVAGLAIVTAGTAVVAVFLYSQRPTQRSVVVLAQFLTFALAAVLYGGLYLTGELSVRAGDAIRWGKVSMLAMPAVAYVLFLLARRGIDHDIELVKSMDRLR